jgi:FAD/FMN-containing dehydrogenase
MPSTAVQVSEFIALSSNYDCKFAVKSGGHSSNVGASNVQYGITVDLRRLNEVKVSQDKDIVRLGPGNRWYKVYEALEPHGLTVPGARTGTLGVGGFILGGKR